MSRCIGCGITDEELAAPADDGWAWADGTIDESAGELWSLAVTSDAPGQLLEEVWRVRPMRALRLPGYSGLGVCWPCLTDPEAIRSLERALLSDDPEDLVRVLQEPHYTPVRAWLSEAAADRRRRRNEVRAALAAKEEDSAGGPGHVDNGGPVDPAAEARPRARPGRRRHRISGLSKPATRRRLAEVRYLYEVEELTFEQIARRYTVAGREVTPRQVANWYRWSVDDLISPAPDSG